MTANNKKVTYIDHGPYPVYIGLCNNKAAFKKELKKLEIKEEDARWAGTGGETFCIDRQKAGDRVIIVCCDHKKISTVAEVVAHEATHVMQYIQDKCWPDGGKFDDETQAYIVGWIVNKWFTEMR